MTTMAPTRPARRHGCRVRLATGPAAAAEARRRVRSAIQSWQIPVTNAVRHEAGQAVMLVVTCARGQLRVDVHDTSPSWPAVADVSADAETGRGLLLVETLSDEWGFYRTPAGKAVYFMLAFQPDQADQPAQPERPAQPAQAPAAGGRGPQRVNARGRWTVTPPSAHRPRRTDLTVPAARLPSA
jgi:hypothetical protein